VIGPVIRSAPAFGGCRLSLSGTLIQPLSVPGRVSS